MFDPGPVPYFVEIVHEIISTVILLLPLIQGLLSVTNKSMCMVNRLVKLAHVKVWLGELTVST